LKKKKVKRHSALMEKASEEALAGSVWEYPYRWYGRLCGLFSLFAHLRQVCTYQRLSERQRDGIVAYGCISERKKTSPLGRLLIIARRTMTELLDQNLHQVNQCNNYAS
jgi:hypothetical protein